MINSVKARIAAVREDGFTLTELAVGIIIIGILAAIALPIYLNAQKSVSSLDVTTGLQQAATLMDAEKNDNNGFYPKYMPNELLANSLWKTFAYTYSDDRLNYCLQGQDSAHNKFFISNTSRTANTTDCTQKNIGDNSVPPFGQVVIPTIDTTSFSMTWSSSSAAAVATVSWNPGVCKNDQGQTIGSANYEVRVTDNGGTSNPGAVVKSGFQNFSTTSTTISLTGFLPGDNVIAQVHAECVETTNGKTYYYDDTNWAGASQTGVVPTFSPISAPTFATNPASYYDGSNVLRANAVLNTITCPTIDAKNSVAVYRLSASMSGQSTIYSGAPSTSPNVSVVLQSGSPATNWPADQQITYNGYAACQLIGTAKTITTPDITSTPVPSATPTVTTTEYSPLQPPTAGTIYTTNDSGGTDVLPNYFWSNAATCAYGTVEYRFVEESPAAGYSPWQTWRNWNTTTNTGVSPKSFAVNTSYTWHGEYYCAGTNRSSATVSSPTITFTTYYNTPDTPATPANLNHSTTDPTQTQTETWSPVTCDRGGSAQYWLAQTTHNGTAYSTPNGYANTGWITGTSYNVSSWIDQQGNNYDYQVMARCVNGNGNSANSAYADDGVFTEGVQTPGTPSISNNNYTTVNWTTVSCPSGTYDAYYAVQTLTNGSSTSTVLVNNGNGTTSATANGSGKQSQTVTVKAICIGAHANSAYGGTTSTSWTIYAVPSITAGFSSCSGNDVFDNINCTFTVDPGYPGSSTGSSITSGNPGGLNISVSGSTGTISGTPTNTGSYAIYANDSNAAGTTPNTYLGTPTFDEYYQGDHTASSNWHAYSVSGAQTTAGNGALSYQPCTLGVSGCSSAYFSGTPSANGSGVMKLVSSKATSTQGTSVCWSSSGSNAYGQCGQVVFTMRGLITNHTYSVSCWVESFVGVVNSSSSAGITQFGLQAGSGNYTMSSTSWPNKQWYHMPAMTFSASGTTEDFRIMGSNNDNGSEHEWEVSGCTIKY